MPAAAKKDAIIGLARRSRGLELPGWEAGWGRGSGKGTRGERREGDGAGLRQRRGGCGRWRGRPALQGASVAPGAVGPLPAGWTPLEGGPPRLERPLAGPGRGGRLLPVPSLSLSSAILLRSRRPGDAWRHTRSRRPCPLQPPRESSLGHRRLRSLRAGDPRAGAGEGSERAPLPHARAPVPFPLLSRGLSAALSGLGGRGSESAPGPAFPPPDPRGDSQTRLPPRPRVRRGAPRGWRCGLESAAGEPGSHLAAAPEAGTPGGRGGRPGGGGANPGPRSKHGVVKAAVADTNWKVLMATETCPPGRLDTEVKCPLAREV